MVIFPEVKSITFFLQLVLLMAFQMLIVHCANSQQLGTLPNKGPSGNYLSRVGLFLIVKKGLDSTTKYNVEIESAQHNSKIALYSIDRDSKITDSIVYDEKSLHYVQTTSLDSLNPDSLFRFTLRKSKSLTNTEEIADILILPVQKTKDSNTESSIKVIDSVQRSKEPFLNVHGSITTVGQISDVTYTGQGIPTNFIRSHLNARIEIGGLPFNTSTYYTSEGLSNQLPISNFNLSFENDLLIQKLKEKLDRKTKDVNQQRFVSVSKFPLVELQQKRLALQQELENPNYIKGQLKLAKTIEACSLDTTLSSSFRCTRAKQKLQEHQNKLSTLKNLNEQILGLEKQHKSLELDASLPERNISEKKAFRKSLRRYHLANPQQEVFLSVKRLDIGMVNLLYNDLVLGGVNLTGVNTELNPGFVYGAIAYGKVSSNLGNFPGNFNVSRGRRILGGRVGFGKKEKLLFAISALKGRDDNSSVSAISRYNSWFRPIENKVSGIDVSYSQGKQLHVTLEYAKSQSIDARGFPYGQNEESIFSIQNKNNTNAWAGRLNANLNNNRTNLGVLFRYVDPDFVSFGSPNLRSDNLRMEFMVEQFWAKNQISAELKYRRDEDNVRNQREGTSTFHTFSSRVNLRFKNYPYVSAMYLPTYQYLFLSSDQGYVVTKSKVINIVTGYNYRTGTNLLATTLMVSDQRSQSNQQQQFGNYHITQFTLQETLLKQALNLSLSGGGSLIVNQKADSISSWSVFSNLSKGIFRNRITILSGYTYARDNAIVERHRLDCGFSTKLFKGTTILAQAETHIVRVIVDSRRRSYQQNQLARLTLIQTF